MDRKQPRLFYPLLIKFRHFGGESRSRPQLTLLPIYFLSWLNSRPISFGTYLFPCYTINYVFFSYFFLVPAHPQSITTNQIGLQQRQAQLLRDFRISASHEPNHPGNKAIHTGGSPKPDRAFSFDWQVEQRGPTRMPADPRLSSRRIWKNNPG